jgi:signal transduction histidine kinase
LQLASRAICLQTGQFNVPISADRISLLRILRNLVDNALKYGGPLLNTITIGYREEENHHIITVQDNGKGFAEEHTNELFTAYYRVSTGVDTGGAGLGLAIVREIATQHGGTAWADAHIGRGAAFSVSIRKGLES